MKQKKKKNCASDSKETIPSSIKQPQIKTKACCWYENLKTKRTQLSNQRGGKHCVHLHHFIWWVNQFTALTDWWPQIYCKNEGSRQLSDTSRRLSHPPTQTDDGCKWELTGRQHDAQRLRPTGTETRTQRSRLHKQESLQTHSPRKQQKKNPETNKDYLSRLSRIQTLQIYGYIF